MQQARPEVETTAEVTLLWGSVFVAARAHHSRGVLRNVESEFEAVFGCGFSVAQALEKFQSQSAEIGKTIGILLEIAEHVVMLGAEVVVAAVFGIDQGFEELALGIGRQCAQQGAAGAQQRLHFDLSQESKKFLPGLAEAHLLAHQERRNPFVRLHHFLLPQAL